MDIGHCNRNQVCVIDPNLEFAKFIHLFSLINLLHYTDYSVNKCQILTRTRLAVEVIYNMQN